MFALTFILKFYQGFVLIEVTEMEMNAFEKRIYYLQLLKKKKHFIPHRTHGKVPGRVSQQRESIVQSI